MPGAERQLRHLWNTRRRKAAQALEFGDARGNAEGYHGTTSEDSGSCLTESYLFCIKQVGFSTSGSLDAERCQMEGSVNDACRFELEVS
jgi:hypothetical protein